MRITTNQILRNYKSNLATSLTNLDSARVKVMTRRKFTATAEDPASALRASVLERKYARNEDYLSLVKDVQSFQDSQEDAAMQINTIAKQLSKQYGLEALNGTNGSLDTRETYADAWRGSQESILLSLNASYEGKYVFAGSDGQKAPFKLGKDTAGNQALFYRNVDVTTGFLYNDDGTLKDNDPAASKERLENLSKDSVFVDLGFGLNINDDSTIDSSSAFNTSLPGINMVGYGEFDNGDPKNMILLMGKIADELEKPDFNYERYRELVNEFDEGRNDVLEVVTTLGTQTEFLTTTRDRLETNEISLATQIDNVVNVDMAEAIMNFSWAQYAYNASLKVGNNILTPSFIDFMR
ncbi:flagellin N-terminal helical domain-containing protein [Sporofaciens musculi]|uniref:flagellin N-terminal helical domain-containing protein n=1 Tax=Sporofaciens musculi TaxID=2681861 RepID=UPI00256FCD54|nr:flagellin [Sporofaciens musculi]